MKCPVCKQGVLEMKRYKPKLNGMSRDKGLLKCDSCNHTERFE
jgi:hypothetical protein|tara:strand:+ start:177 stop:305 length:129 start_codon:yes stop_codon:yes gene_type:complete